MHHGCQKAPRIPFVDALFVLYVILLYKPSNTSLNLWNARLDGIGHLINPLLSYNGILPQLAIKLCNISVKVEMTRNIIITRTASSF